MPRILGTCSNCKRPGMKINNTKGTGICGSCRLHIIGTEPGSPEREAGLKEAAEKYAGKPKMTRGHLKKDKVEENGKSVMPDPDWISENIIMIPIRTDADRKLLEAIGDQAQQYRRTTDQQILWLCQNEIKIHNELLKEAAEDYVERKSQAMEADNG
jgi:hypothetical protein